MIVILPCSVNLEFSFQMQLVAIVAHLQTLNAGGGSSDCAA